jgi:aspartate/methionine/tyrosine aminotransferase
LTLIDADHRSEGLADRAVEDEIGDPVEPTPTAIIEELCRAARETK